MKRSINCEQNQFLSGMLRRWIGVSSVTCVAMFVVDGAATPYTNYINESVWQTDTSVFECAMKHEIPYFGTAVFRTRAGENSSFYVDGFSSRLKKGQASISARPPLWKPQTPAELLGYVSVKQAKNPFSVGNRMTERMLSQLNDGAELELVRKSWYLDQKAGSLKAVVSNIGFREVYAVYLGCLASLLPANFDQLERTSLYFSPSGSADLTPSSYEKLDHILLLVKHDPSIKKFYIDGHTSTPGDRTTNLELSKSRAEMAAQYLKNNGIKEDQLVVRWHGERYPIASNQSFSGRAKNRRVTVRLEKVTEEGEQMDDNKMEMAAK